MTASNWFFIILITIIATPISALIMREWFVWASFDGVLYTLKIFVITVMAFSAAKNNDRTFQFKVIATVATLLIYSSFRYEFYTNLIISIYTVAEPFIVGCIIYILLAWGWPWSQGGGQEVSEEKE